MLGNDVVDLEDPDTLPESFRPRFDERVFDPTERRAIAHARDPHARRWMHWAAKEAAYKLARQIDPRFVFSPSKLVARFADDASNETDRIERRGMLDLPKALAPGFAALELWAEIVDGRVHVIALPRGEDWAAVVSSVEVLPAGGDPSEEVRRLARECVSRDLGLSVDRVTIGRRDRIPTVEIDGRRCHMALSLSHHGRFVAVASNHRVELATEPALDHEIGVA